MERITTRNSLDVKVNGDILLGLGYNAQAVQQFGRNSGTTGKANNGTAYILGLGWGMDMNGSHGAMPVRVHGEFGRGSADYQSIAAGKRFGKIWGEHTTLATAPS